MLIASGHFYVNFSGYFFSSNKQRGNETSVNTIFFLTLFPLFGQRSFDGLATWSMCTFLQTVFFHFCASSDLSIITTEITTVLNFLVIFLIKKNHFTCKEFLLRKSPAVVQRTTKHEKNSITFFFEALVSYCS